MNIVKKIIDFVMDILETVVFVGSLFIVLYLFIMQPNQVKGTSMEPTFHTGDYILTSKITYRLRSPARGDVIVLKSPKNPDIDYIKRIVGLPGDTIEIQNGHVYVNHKLFVEKYINVETYPLSDDSFAKEGQPFTLADGMYFVMGDNRPASSDSREFGPIPTSSIIGYVFYRYYPADKIGIIKNPLE